MAGDEFELHVCDEKKETLDYIRIGKMRYWSSKFSLQKYTWNNSVLYYQEHRLSDGRIQYSILDDENIDEIQFVLSGTPITQEEQNAYDDTKRVFNWIQEKREQWKKDIHFTIVTFHDF